MYVTASDLIALNLWSAYCVITGTPHYMGEILIQTDEFIYLPPKMYKQLLKH